LIDLPRYIGLVCRDIFLKESSEMTKQFFLLAIMTLAMLANHALAQQPRQTTAVDIFVGGVGYPNYRIPTLATALDGTLIAIVEGRTGDDAGFGGDTDLIMKRSFDNGATWTSTQVLEQPSLFGEKVSNPATVVDQTNGRVWVLYNRFEGNLGTTDSQPGTTNNTAWARFSDNSGATWSSAIDITTGAKDFNNWNTVAFGPGSGIQATNGRLIVPSARWQTGQGWSSYAVYSDDNGTTWGRGALSSASNASNENNIVQLANGQIMMDGRQNSASPSSRVKYLSNNGGDTWLSPPMPGQFATSVHAASTRYTLQSAGDDLNRILWTGPGDPTDRFDLVVRTSYNEGGSFTNERLLIDGYSGYSDMSLLADGGVGILLETNQGRSIAYTSINRAFIEPSAGLRAYDDFRYASNNILGNKNGGYGWSGGWARNADLSGVANPIIEASDLHYTNFPFVTEGIRRPVFFSGAGGSMARALQTPLDLNIDETYYFSLLVRTDTDVFDNEDATEALDISLLAGTSQIAAFGVQGDESIYVENIGARFSTAADTLSKDVEYYLVGKLVAGAGSFDQLFLSVFQSGQAVPTGEAGMTWMLAGTTAMNSTSMIDRLMVTGGNAATWVLDELRIGTSFGDVVSNAAPAIIGDLDGDGFVGIADLNIVLSAWNQSVPPGNPLADADGDGFVGIADLNVVLGNWNAGTPPASGASIPEPTVGLLWLAMTPLVARRRRTSHRATRQQG
jgi:sialidase-1